MIYDPDDYNRFDVLKPPLELVFINIYVLRYALFIFLPLVPRIGEKLKWFSGLAHVDILMMLSVIPAVVFSIAWLRRTPDGKPWHRTVWRHGRSIYIGAVSYDMVLLIIYMLIGHRVMDGLMFGFVYLDAIIIFYLFRSQQLRDACAEFPEKDAGERPVRQRGKYNPRSSTEENSPGGS